MGLMKRIFLLLSFLVCFFVSKAQILQKQNTYGIGFNRTGADTLIYIPSDTLSVPSWGVGKTHIARKGTTLYYWDGSKWSAISGSGGTYTAGNGLTLSGSQFKLGGTLTENTTIDASTQSLELTGTGNADISMSYINNLDNRRSEVYVSNTNAGMVSNLVGVNVSELIVHKDSIVLYQQYGDIRLRNINYTLSTIGKKVMIRDTTTGAVQNIDPALFGASPGGSTKQFQYNNAGAFAGSGMLTQETNQILVTGNSDATTIPFAVEAHEDLTAPIIVAAQSGVKKIALHSNGSIEMQEVSAPATPASGYGRMYAKSDGKIYFKNDAGTEYDLTSSGSVGAASGTGISLVNGSSLIKRLKEGTGITITDNTDSVTISRVSDSTMVRNLRWKYRNTLDYNEDYEAASFNRWVGSATGAGSTANDNSFTMPNWMLDYFGAVKNETGTTTTGSAISYYGAPSSGASGTFRNENTKNLSFEVGKVLFPVLSDSTGGSDIYKAAFGLFDWWASDITQAGIQIFYDRASHGNYWAIRSDNGSVSTVVTTTPIEDSTRYTIRLEVSRWDLGNSGGSVRVYINDVEVVASSGTYPITTNIPYATWQGNPFYLGLYIKKSAGTNSRVMYADWTHIYAETVDR